MCDPFHKSGLATIITSRGCPYQCRFCFCGMMNQGKWRTRSPANILGEIEDLYRTAIGRFFSRRIILWSMRQGLRRYVTA